LLTLNSAFKNFSFREEGPTLTLYCNRSFSNMQFALFSGVMEGRWMTAPEQRKEKKALRGLLIPKQEA
jgi:hypothetical protein